MPSRKLSRKVCKVRICPSLPPQIILARFANEMEHEGGSRGRLYTTSSATDPIKARPIWPRTGEAAGQNKTAERPKPSQPILERWPEGYSSFKLDGDGVILFGGKPPLRIKG
jgi:hypothetical protein